jgi:maltose alpha-D-glucosyltransferase / alpha-amylase
VFVHNLSDRRIECRLNVAEDGEEPRAMICLQSDERSDPDDKGNHHLVMEPYGFNWYRLRRQQSHFAK